MINELKKIANRRWYSHKKRCEEINKEIPIKDDFIELLIENYKNGFKCSYCKKVLKLKDTFPYKDTPSIDHKQPLSLGGSSSKDNLIICCVACNIIKGTLSSTTYQTLLEKIEINSPLFNQIFNESFNGKFANKIERRKEENDSNTT